MIRAREWLLLEDNRIIHGLWIGKLTRLELLDRTLLCLPRAATCICGATKRHPIGCRATSCCGMQMQSCPINACFFANASVTPIQESAKVVMRRFRTSSA